MSSTDGYVSGPPHPTSGVVAISPAETSKLLGAIIVAAKEHAPKSIVAFDLDSTLLNNSPRQSQILREYGKSAGVEPLCQSAPAHWDSWDFKAPMVRAGLSEFQAADHLEPFTEFWRRRFFTSEYCQVDVATPGAPEFVNELVRAGAQICYLTGRQEDMRDGTVACFKREGFPIPGSESVYLWMKPTLDEHDDAFKLASYKELKKRGTVVAAFDNEPTHINGYKETFPDAAVVHLDTDCSPRPVKVQSGIPSVKNFER